MKRIIILIIVALAAITGIQAQNANRRGAFIELQGGTALGTVIEKENEIRNSQNYYSYDYIYSPYLKGGAVGSFDFGYRFVTSNSFAIELKADVWANFGDFSKTLCVDFMPGIRWTSKEFSSNKSFFAALNAGIGYEPWFTAVNIPVEIGFGVNFTNHLYLGIFLSERIKLDDYHYFGENGIDFLKNMTYTSVGLRLGYRF